QDEQNEQEQEEEFDDPEFQSILTSNTNLGIITSDSLRLAKQANTGLPIIANGGITNSLEVFNSLALGAKMAGIAGYFLFQLSQNKLEKTIESWQKQLPLLYAIYGVTKSEEISQLKEIDPYDLG
ncbi:alpha-hydroxy-acid oxidizing protein, partial [Oenococcus oeni]